MAALNASPRWKAFAKQVSSLKDPNVARALLSPWVSKANVALCLASVFLPTGNCSSFVFGARGKGVEFETEFQTFGVQSSESYSFSTGCLCTLMIASSHQFHTDLLVPDNDSLSTCRKPLGLNSINDVRGFSYSLFWNAWRQSQKPACFGQFFFSPLNIMWK